MEQTSFSQQLSNPRSRKSSSQNNTMQQNESNISDNNNNSNQQKKGKSKSFNRKNGTSQQQYNLLVHIYRQIQYSSDIRKLLKRFLHFDKQKIQRLIIGQLKDTCEMEMKRLNTIKKTNKQVQRFLVNQDIDELDNQLSIIALNTQIRFIFEMKAQTEKLKANASVQSLKGSNVMSRQYENLLLEVEKSDQLIKNFVNTNLNITNSTELNLQECKKFFKRQITQINKSSDRVILSRKILYRIIIFLCRILEGQIITFNDVFDSYNQVTIQTEIDENNKIRKVTKKKQIRLKTMDQQQDDFADHQSSKSSNINKNDWNGLSSRDLGLKVNQLAQICEQIPQLETFTRTLKFCKITLENRQSFFKIVDVIIALHRKIGYLSRNKPTLLKQMQDIQFQLNSISASVHEFVSSLQSQMPSFAQLNFSKQDEENSKHQMTEILYLLRKDLRRLSEIINDQQKFQNQLFDKIGLIKTIIQTFWLNVNENDESWEDFFKKLSNQDLDQEQSHILHQLNECLIIFQNQLKNQQRNQSSLQTQRKLQSQVHTLLQQFQRQKAQNQQLKRQLSLMMQQRDQMQTDIQERNKMILNLTNLKVSYEKRQRSLKQQLLNAQEDCRSFQQIINDLHNELERLSIENENHQKDLIYDHQDEIKELVDKISELEKAKMELLQKYQFECMKSIQNLHGSNHVNLQLQNLKDLLERKTKQFDQDRKKNKQIINQLQKELQELRNSKQLLQNQLELSQRNKKRLMEKLDQISNKSQQNIKDMQSRLEDELSTVKDNNYKLQKQLQKQKRNNKLLNDSIEHMKDELASNLTLINQYRIKYSNFSSLQNQYDILLKQHEKKIKAHEKLEALFENQKDKFTQLSLRLEETEDELNTLRQQLKKQQKRTNQLQDKLAQTLSCNQNLDAENNNLQKANKNLLKKYKQIQNELQNLQAIIDSKQKNSNSLLNRSQIRYQQLQQEQQKQNSRLNEKIKQLQKTKDKNQKQINQLGRQIKDNLNQYEIKYDQFLRLKKQYQRKLHQRDSKISQLEDLTQKLTKELKENKLFIDQKQKQAETFQKQRNQYKITLITMQRSQSKMKNDLTKLQDDIQRLNEQVEKLKRKVNQRQRELNQYNTQHSIEMQIIQKKIRKDVENQFSQILFKQKQNFNNFSIQHMKELDEIKRKYQKIIRDEKNQKQSLQQEYDSLIRRLNNLQKSYDNLINNKESQIIPMSQQQANKLRGENDMLRRQTNRLSQDLSRLQRQISDTKQQNSSLIAKNIQLQHQINLLSTKNNQLTINLQTTMRSLSSFTQLQLQKNQLERQLEKYKNKNLNEENKLNDLKIYITQLELRLKQIQAKLTNYRNKQYQWNSTLADVNQKNKILLIQFNQIKDKLNLLSLDLQSKDQKIKQKQFENKTLQEELNTKNRLLQDKQRHLRQIQNNFTLFRLNLDKQNHNWTDKESNYKQQIDILQRKIRQIQFQLENIRKTSLQSSKITTQLSQLQHDYQNFIDKYQKLQNQYNFLTKRFKTNEQQKDAIIKQRDQIITIKSNIEMELQKYKYQNNQIKSQLNTLNNELKRMIFQNQKLSNQITLKNKNIEKSSQLQMELNKLKQFYQKQLKRLQTQLTQHFQNQKQLIINQFDRILADLNEKLQNSHINNQTLTDSNLILQKKISDLENIVEKLKKQNLQFSDHCQKYQQKIKLLQQEKINLSDNLGNIISKLELKYNVVNDQKSRLQQKVKNLQNQILKLSNNNKKISNDLIMLRAQLDEARRSSLITGEEKGKVEQRFNIQVNQLQIRINSAQQALKQLQNQKESQKARYQKIISQLKAENENLRRILGELEQKNHNLDINIKKQHDIFLKDCINFQKHIAQLIQQLDNNRRRLFQLQNIINDFRSREVQSKQQETQQIARLKTQSALRAQQILRLNEVIKKKDQDYSNEMKKIVDQKNLIFRDNQGFKNQILILQRKLSEIQNLYKLKLNENQALNAKLNQLTLNIQRMGIQITNLNKQILQRNKKQNDLIQNLSKSQNDLRKMQNEYQIIRNQLNNINQQGESYKLTESQFKADNQRLQTDLERLLGQNGRFLSQNERLKGQLNNLLIQIQRFKAEIHNLTIQITKYRSENEKMQKNLTLRQIKIGHMSAQIQRLNQDIHSRLSASNSQRNDFEKSQNQLLHYKNVVAGLQRQNIQIKRVLGQFERENNQIRNILGSFERQNADNKNTINLLARQNSQLKNTINLLTKQNSELKNTTTSHQSLVKQNIQLKGTITILERQINEHKDTISSMTHEIHKGKSVMQSADRQLKRVHEQKSELFKSYNELKNTYEELLRKNEDLIRKHDQLLRKYRQKQQEVLNSSRGSSINLVTKSYIYQGGKITTQEFNKLHEEYLRLLKQIQNRTVLIQKLKSQNQSYLKEIRVLKEQIQLLSEGKTINIKGYTRITNPNDLSLNAKGVLYTQYDVKQYKAKIQLLQQALTRYQNRQTQLLNEIQKYKFRQKIYLDQLKQSQQSNKNKNDQEIKSLTKLTSFDQKKQLEYPISSTYKLQGIQTIQKTINMNKNSHQIVRIQIQQLSKIIERITTSNHIMTIKIDQILYNSMKLANNQSLERILSSTQYNLPVSVVNEIRESVHQNRALVQTLKALKQNRQDIDLLLQQYIHPELVTEFVYRILTYFSEVDNDTQQAKNIREQLNRIRRENVGGYYFTVLQQYTKYILQNNSIELYKEELRQKARQLNQLRQKLNIFFDTKLSEKDRLLNKSSSKGSLMTRSRGKFLSNSREQGINDINNPSLITVNQQMEKQKTSSQLSYTPYVTNSNSQMRQSQRQKQRQRQTSPYIQIQGMQRVSQRISQSSTSGPRVIYVGNSTERSDTGNSTSSNTRYITLSNHTTNNITRITTSTTSNSRNVIYRGSTNANNL